jgi:hypothetical protein
MNLDIIIVYKILTTLFNLQGPIIDDFITGLYGVEYFNFRTIICYLQAPVF